jgi:hypothetical protein
MALLPDVFKPDEADDDPFAPIDAGWYEAEIIKSEMKVTNDKKGKYLSLCFKVTEGEHKGRMFFTNLNIVNNSETAVKIARSDLKKICTACGIDDELADSKDIHNIPMGIKLSVKEETSHWPAKNEIKNYCHVDDLEEGDANPLDD